MRFNARLFSVPGIVISLASLSALATVAAIPIQSDPITLARRSTVEVQGKFGELGKQLSSDIHTKSTVHELTKWDGKTNPGAVIKKYPDSDPYGVTDHEVAGLRAVGQYIHHGTKSVVMHKVEGKSLADLVAQQPRKSRRQFVHSWKPKVAAHAAEIARSKGILHGDLNMGNVIIHKGQVQLVDWEHHYKKGHDEYTHDEQKIQNNFLDLWDSVGTPRGGKKASIHKSGSPKPSSNKPSGSPSASHKSGSPKSSSPKSGSPKPSSHKSGSPKPSSHKSRSPKSSSHKRRSLTSQR